jgi:hypothetical protein
MLVCYGRNIKGHVIVVEDEEDNNEVDEPEPYYWENNMD